MMRAALRFVFGSGWWVPWHMLLLLTLVPVALSLSWMSEIVPGAGPQGGEAIFAFLFTAVFALIGFSLVDGALWAATLKASWARRYLSVPALILGAWFGLLFVLYWLADLATGLDADALTRRAGWLALIATFAAIYGANLWALARARAGRARTFSPQRKSITLPTDR